MSITIRSDLPPDILAKGVSRVADRLVALQDPALISKFTRIATAGATIDNASFQRAILGLPERILQTTF